MSKRRYGGVWTRKASNLAAKEGWSERESNIKDFMKYSQERNLNIEWASSDEEDKSSKSVKTAIVHKIYKFNSDQQVKKDIAFCNFNDKLEDFGLYNKRKFSKTHKEHKSSYSCLNHKIALKNNVRKIIENSKDKDTAILEQVLSHKYNENSNTFGTHSTVKVRVNESDDEKELEISPVIVTHNLTSKKIKKYQQDTEKYQQDQKDTEKDIGLYNSVKNSVVSEKKSPVFKTSIHLGKSSPTSLSPQNKSPVLSSVRKCEHKNSVVEPCSPVFKSKVKSAYKSPKIGTQNIIEPESPGSPVLNSRRVLKRKLRFGYHSAPNKPLVRDVPVQPHTEHGTRNTFYVRKKISDNVFTPLSREGNSVIRIKKKQRNLALAFSEHKEDNFKGTVGIKEGLLESNNGCSRMEFEKIDSMSNGNCSLERNSIILKNGIRYNADVEDLNNKVNVNFKIKTIKPFFKSYLDCVDQSIMAIEDVNDTTQAQSESQESEPIEECITPSKETSSHNVFHNTECLVKSVSKCNKNPISVQKENVEGQKGSEWLQALHQKTPERPCKDNEQIADPDSSKKKILKDGLAARLRRLLTSWQSSAQMWKHQISISEEQNPQKTTAACSTTLQAPKLLQLSQSSDLSYTSDGSIKRQVKEKLLREVKSPALRNLRCALFVGPTESSKRQETVLEPPKKNLLLKIVKIGGRLPAGGALCEKVLDSLDTSNLYQVINGVEAIHNNDKIYSNSLHISEKNQHKSSERFVVIFATQEQNHTISFQVNDQVIIYSPWHHLDLPGQNIPTLFSSYFTIRSGTWQLNEGKVGEWSKSPLKRKINKKKVILTSWSCLCTTDSTILPTICEGRNFHLKHKADMFNLSIIDRQHKIENDCGNFKVIQENSNKLPMQNNGRPQSWSIVEAIEKCGGLSDIPINVILHVYRIIRNKNLFGSNDHWLLIGADIMGVFCTVTIPDRPLAKHLSPLLDEGEGTIRAFTQLTVTQRHTDNKSPGLFSLLHSLHHCYQKAIKEYENLMTLYIHNDSKAPQSFCYNFTVTLGSTKSQLVTGIPNVPISLPLWSVPESLKVSGVAQRGSIFLHIIYKVDCYLYVICPDEYPRTSGQSLFSVTSKEESRRSATYTIKSSETEDSICKEKSLSLNNDASWVTRVSVQEGSTLPTWLAKDGTIMQGAIIRDIISYKGALMVDEFSELKMKKSEVKLTLGNLYHILPKLQPDSNSHQLVHVSGNICYVDEENAFSWPICEHCTSEKLQDTLVQYGGMECLKCGKINLSPATGYSLEVFLNCMELPNISVKIKLYQRTIKKLISSCLVSEGEGYDATYMIGRVLGPLVCFIEEVKSRTITNPRTFVLLQLPY